MNDDEMLTAEEVAKIMKVSLKTVRKWVQSGDLASISIGSREYRISRRDLNSFLEEQKRKRQHSD